MKRIAAGCAVRRVSSITIALVGLAAVALAVPASAQESFRVGSDAYPTVFAAPPSSAYYYYYNYTYYTPYYPAAYFTPYYFGYYSPSIYYYAW